MSSNSVCNHTRDKQIGLPLRGRAILLSLVWLQTKLASTQSYYHYLLLRLESYLYKFRRLDFRHFDEAYITVASFGATLFLLELQS